MEQKAGNELQTYFRKITGVLVPIVLENDKASDSGIFVGSTARAASGGLDREVSRLVPEGFIVRCSRDSLLILGSNDLGSLFGAYELLERLGVSPNPPEDTDGRREDSGRGWVRELQGRWPGVLG